MGGGHDTSQVIAGSLYGENASRKWICIGLGTILNSGEGGSSCSCVAKGVSGYITVGEFSVSSSSGGGVRKSVEEEEGSDDTESDGDGVAEPEGKMVAVLAN